MEQGSLGIRKVLIFLFIFCLTDSYAQELVGNVRKPFTITVEGLRKDMQYIQKRSELQMARNTDFCRGSMMPKASGEWSCKGKGPGEDRCELEYRCRSVSRQFNRKTESQRLRKDLKGLAKPTSKFIISVSKKPVRNLGRYQGNRRRVARPSQSKALTLRKKRMNKALGNEQYVELENFEDQIEVKKAQVVQEEEVEVEIDTDDDELADLEEEIEAGPEEDVWKVETERNTDGEEEVYRVVKKERTLDQADKSPFQWLSFAGSFLRVSDNLDNSLAAFDLAWTPFYHFNKNWSLRGNFGAHFFSLASVDGTTATESFLVLDYGAALVLRFDRFYVEGGFGLQQWNNTLGDSLNSLLFGFGYKFKNYQFKYIDRAFVSFTKLSNDIRNNTEMRFGIGVSF